MRSELRVLPAAAGMLLCCAAARAQDAPSLGEAASFAVLGRSVHNSGPSRVTGNLGADARDGFPPGTVSLGEALSGNHALTRAARDDLAAALRPRSCTATLATLQDRTVAPGVYCLPPIAELRGTVTLDGGGNPDAVWIFQTTGTLTTASESSVVMRNGAQRGNIHWLAGAAVVGSGTTFAGNLLAPGDIRIGSSAAVSGRALSLRGAVTLDTSDVSLCCDPIALPPSLPAAPLRAPYSATFTASGGTAPYRFELVAGALPAGLTLSAGGTLSGTPTAPGRFTFAVKVTDSRDCSRVRSYTLDVCEAVPIAPLPVDELPACVPFTHRFANGPVAWSGTLPAGLTLSEEGVLSGTPSVPGSYTFTVMAGCASTSRVTVTVSCPPVTFSPSALPDGVVGVEYSPGIEATGSCAPYTVTPASILATREGAFTFTATATTDRASCSATREYTVRFHSSAPAIPTLSEWALLALTALLAAIAVWRTHD